MAWKFQSGTSINTQIVDRLRTEILNSTYESGSPFPTVRQLANIAGVNPNTMQKALSQLEEERLLVTRSTTGRFVTDDEGALDEARKKAMKSFTSNVIRDAKRSNINLDSLLQFLKEEWNNYE